MANVKPNPKAGAARNLSSASTPKSRTAQPRREGQPDKREAILTAALEEFSASGFAAARLDDVARRAGVAKGTIYLYFRDKEDLFQELIRATLTPLVGVVEGLRDADMPMPVLADRIADLFVTQIYMTNRKDVVRLMITEGRRFPKLAEFYYREVLLRVIGAMRALLRRAADRGEVSPALAQYPQIVVAPGIVAIFWAGLFDRFEPLDVRAMMQAHLRIILASGRVP